jgi:hypothetical protein
MSGARYEIQSFDFANGGRSWHVYDTIEHYHIHTATHGFLNEDHSEPICCTKICAALNAMEAAKTNIQQPKVDNSETAI